MPRRTTRRAAAPHRIVRGVDPGRWWRRWPSSRRRCSAMTLDSDASASTRATLSLFVLPFLTGYFAWKRELGVVTAVAGAAVSPPRPCSPTSFHSRPQGDTEVLTALHLPIALLAARRHCLCGRPLVRGRGRMDFVRFSGELFIYYVLIALGGGVLTAFTMMMFNAIGMNAELVRAGLADSVRRGRRGHRRLVAGRGEAERHREHGAGADAPVHAAVHRRPAGVPGDHGSGPGTPSTSSARC